MIVSTQITKPEIFAFIAVLHAFFISNAFFQLSLSVASLFSKLSFKCCLGVAYYIGTLSYRDTLYFLYLSLCLRLGLYISYLCHHLTIIIFIFIKVNYTISVIQTNLFLGHICQKFSLRVLLSSCLIFCQFQPGIAYKSVAYKNSVQFSSY